MLERLLNAIDAFGVKINIKFFLIVIAIIVVARIVFWLIGAAGVCKLSKIEEIKAPKLAFIPFLYPFALGRLAEKCNQKEDAKSSKYSIWLVLLSVLGVIFCVAFFVVLAISTVLIAQNVMDSLGKEADIVIIELFAPMKYVIILYFIAIALCVSYLVLYFVALWRIYKKYAPNKAILLTILSVIFRFLSPAFLFMISVNQNKNKDEEILFQFEE